MLFDLQRKTHGLDKTLEFLLKKSDQWTSISDVVVMRSPELAKRQIASRIMSKRRITFEVCDESH